MPLRGGANGFVIASSLPQAATGLGSVPPAGLQRSVHLVGESLPRPSGQTEIVSCVAGVEPDAPWLAPHPTAATATAISRATRMPGTK